MTGQPTQSNSGTGEAFYIAPSLVYNFAANKGLTFGVRLFAGGRNEAVTTMPMLVFDYYLAPEG